MRQITTFGSQKPPRPRHKGEQTKLDPGRVVVYFDLVFQRYQAQEDLLHVKERHEEEDEVEERRERARRALEGGTRELERQALVELEKKLGVRVYVESSHDDDSVICKVTSLSSWEDVKRFYLSVGKLVSGWDDNIFLDTAYMEASRFVLYPKGVNGPRYGPGETDDVAYWLESNEPSTKLVADLPVVERVGFRVASWDDGTELFRVPTTLRTSVYKTTVSPGSANLRLLGPQGELLCELSLSNWEGQSFEAHELFVAGRRASLSDLRLLDRCAKKLCWFLLSNLLPDFPSQAYEALVQDLHLPAKLPDAFSALADPEIEGKALRHHRWFTDPHGGSQLDGPLFERVADVVEGEEGSDRTRDADHWMVPFDIGSNRYWLCHGSIVKTGRTTRHDARWTVGEGYEPAWVVRTDWIEKNGECTWFVVDGIETVVGAGRTPQEALRDVPAFVWPGEEEAWREKRTDPGRLDVDPEVYLILGEVAPPMWAEEKFWRFAEEK